MNVNPVYRVNYVTNVFSFIFGTLFHFQENECPKNEDIYGKKDKPFRNFELLDVSLLNQGSLSCWMYCKPKIAHWGSPKVPQCCQGWCRLVLVQYKTKCSSLGLQTSKHPQPTSHSTNSNWKLLEWIFSFCQEFKEIWTASTQFTVK